jgi:hypothetical protein
MVSNSPFSPRRARADLVAALPAVGMFAGALLGVILGLTRGVGGPVALGGLGIAAGLVVGLLLRVALRPDPGDRP